MILPVPCANSDACPLAQIVSQLLCRLEDQVGTLESAVADFVRELEAEEAWLHGDKE